MQESKLKKIIIALSVVIPVAVAVLFKVEIDGYNTSFLPPIYASLNALTSIVLILALVMVKNGKIKLHEKLIKFALTLSSLFLLLYVAYHITTPSTSFGGQGWIRSVYYFILISHILLSVVVIPLVLFSYLRGILGQIEQHKRIVKLSFPLWLYVAVSGVIVYIMISPYYV